ncbi:MAG: hypothetical protein OHK0029_31260 [Armatimonadaceae bacterium]
MRLDFSQIRTLPLSERQNKVRRSDLCPLPDGAASSLDVLSLFPNILIGKDFPAYVQAVAQARRNNHPFLLMIGGHVIKTGMSPLIIDLMRRGVVTHLAANGSVSIHDYELALIGETSEDVGANLPDGRFGNWEETGAGLNEAVNSGSRAGLGYGAAVGKFITERNLPNKDISVFAAAWEFGIPVTVHVAFGNDIIHQHPSWDGALMGAASQRDFQLLAESIADLDGGAVMNLGSAVVMPETFLKALSVARNLTGGKPEAFTNAVFDMIRQYRPLVNVAERPTASGGAAAKGYVFTGHHEILFPLFYVAIRRALEDDND